ncbi:MAG: hypothetical protein WC067_03720 [Candidatus Methanomethylophilaceae archaeon]
MAFGFFKNGNERFDDAVDLIKRKEYDKAIAVLQKAIEKNASNKDVAEILIAVLSISDRINDAGTYTNAASVLRSKGDQDFEFGLTTLNTVKLATECEDMAKSITARSMPSGGSEAALQKGQALIGCAREIQSNIGNETLKLNELYNNVSITGLKLALTLMAEGNEFMATGTLWEDPKKAAEYQQMAFNYRRQIGETGEDNQTKIKSYSKSATCWICGRDTTGEGMHFYPMSSDISPQLRKEDKDSPLPSADDTYTSIYVCRACYSAISRRADAIAKHYHEISMNEMRAMDARIQAEIVALQTQISSLRINIR